MGRDQGTTDVVVGRRFTRPGSAPGVDLAAIGELVDAIRADPERAQTTWRATTRWAGAFRSATDVREHAPIAADEPAMLAGGDTAPNPVEHLLAALGSCLVVGYAAAAAVQQIDLRSLEIELEGRLDLSAFLGLAERHAGFTRIDVTTTIDSDADEGQLMRLHEHVVATSPVGNTIERPVELRTQLLRAREQPALK